MPNFRRHAPFAIAALVLIATPAAATTRLASFTAGGATTNLGIETYRAPPSFRAIGAADVEADRPGTVSAVPEPETGTATGALLIAGFAMIGYRQRRRRRRNDVPGDSRALARRRHESTRGAIGRIEDGA